jgi:thiol:disulfide interchange protein DsbD
MTRALPLSLSALLAVALSAGPAAAQPEKFTDLADAKLEVIPPQAKRGETVTVRLTITPKNGGWTYPFNPRDKEQASKNELEFPPPGDLVFLDTPPKAFPGQRAESPKVSDPDGWEEKPRSETQPNGPKDQYYPRAVSWEFRAVVAPDAKLGKHVVGLGQKTRLQACDKSACIPLPRSALPKAELEILDGTSDKVNSADLAAAEAIRTNWGSPVVPAAKGPGAVPVGPNPPPAPNGVNPAPSFPENKPTAESAGDLSQKKPKSLDDYTRDLADVAGRLDRSNVTAVGESDQSGYGPFLLSAALFGLISLITPCVFPMIPITVSIFLKQSHGSLGARLKLAAVYSLTIITVLGLSAFALLRFMSWLSTQPLTNVLLGLLFVVLALSLFGMYELTLPNFLVRGLQAKQAKGGVLGTMFGALAFTVLSFTCVAPFLGGFAGIAQADTGGSLIALPTTREVLGGLAFATAFAAPFFVLALVPGLLKALPRSGGWLDSVKVVMGFLELAAALKFFRTAELRVFSPTAYFTYDLVLAAWVAIAAACGLYLLNVFRLPHDEDRPNIGVPRLLFAVTFLGLAVYLAPALFRAPDGKGQRPSGAVYAWVEAFLLPDSSLPVATDLKDAVDRSLAEAKKNKTAPRPIFLDFTGVTCTNCKYNEENVFTRPEVRRLLDQFDIVQLYTDEVPAQYYSVPVDRNQRVEEALFANQDFQISAFKTETLPTYAVLLPRADGKVEVIAVYKLGKINDVNGFVKFLSDSLERAKAKK